LRILIVKMTSIGDVAHTFPISHAVARHWPEATIDWLVGTAARPLVECLPWVDGTMAYDLTLRDGWGALLRRTREARSALRAHDYDLALDFQGLLRTSIWTLLASPAKKAGRGRWPWLDHAVSMYDHRRTPHAIENSARPLERLGLDLDGMLERYRTEAVPALARVLERRARDTLTEHALDRFWVWLPQSSWPSKSLPLQQVTGAPEAVTHLVIGDTHYREAPLPQGPNWRNLSGLPLPETAGLCLFAERVIGADTGPAHFAALAGASVIGCFGPTRAERFGMRGPAARSEQGACHACYRRRCARAAECLMPAVDRAITEPFET